jgi:hypothetical protein
VIEIPASWSFVVGVWSGLDGNEKRGIAMYSGASGLVWGFA